MSSQADSQWVASRYELHQTLMSDGQRHVWRAFDHLLHRAVVIKGTTNALEFRSVEEEFCRLRQCSHPRIVQPFDLGSARAPSDSGEAGPTLRYFTQPWMPGPSLWDLRGQLSVAEVRHCLLELVEIVAFLHQRRLTRLDLKSAHLLRTDRGWRLIDLDQARPDSPWGPRTLHGTLPYLAPEILTEGRGGPRADLYSVGAVLFEALTGHAPVLRGDTLRDIAGWLPASPVPELPESTVRQAPDLARLCQTLMARQPSARPESAEAVLEALSGSRSDWRKRCPLPEANPRGLVEPIDRVGFLFKTDIKRKGGGVVVLGPPQSGRSRLLAELAANWQCLRKPALKLTAGSYRSRPLGTVNLLAHYLETLTAARAQLEPDDPTAGSDTRADEAREVQTRHALERLRRLGAAAADLAGEPVPILLDDVPELDELSRAVVEKLVQFLPGSGLFLVLARESQDGQLHDGSADLPAVLVPSLEAEDVRKLSEELLGPGALSWRETERLATVTDGAAGWIRDALALRWTDTERSLEDWTPGNEAARVQACWSTLDADTGDVVRSLSILDHSFSAELAAALVVAPDGPFDEAKTPLGFSAATTDGHDASGVPSLIRASLERLTDLGVLTTVTGMEPGGPVFRFRREVLRRAVENALDDAQRRALHLHAACVLERSALFDPGVAAAPIIARHFVAAEQPDRAWPHLCHALEHAQSALCLEEAAAYLRQLIHVAGSTCARAELLGRLGEVESDLGHYRCACETFTASLDMAVLPPYRKARLSAGLGKVLAALGELEAARLLLENTLEDAVRQNLFSRDEQAAHRLTLTWVYLESRDYQAASQALEQARAAGIPANSRQEIFHDYYEARVLVETERDLLPAAEKLEKALSVARQLDYERGQLALLNTLVLVHQRMGHLEDALTRQDEIVQLSQATYDLAWEATTVHNRGRLLWELGQPEQALAQYERSAALRRRLGLRAAEAESLLSAAEILLEHGSLERAETNLQCIERLLGGDVPLGALRAQLSLLQGRILLRKGDYAGLKEQFAEARTQLEKDGDLVCVMDAAADQMELALANARPEDVWELSATVAAIPKGVILSNRRAAERIHLLASKAHRALSGLEGPKNGGRTAGHRSGAFVADVLHATHPDTQAPSSPGDSGNLPRAPEAQCRATPLDTAATLRYPDPVDQVAPLQWLDRFKRLMDVAHDDRRLAEGIATLAADLFSARCVVVLFHREGFSVIEGHGLDTDQANDISNSVVEGVRRTKAPYFNPDIRADQEYGTIRSLRASQVVAVACCPVLEQDRCLGAVYVDTQTPGGLSGPQTIAVIEKIGAIVVDLLHVMAERQPGMHEAELPDFGLVGESEPMRQLKRQIAGLTRSTNPALTVLLGGETGTGKSLVAELLHNFGRRAGKPFFTLSCPTISEGIAESELFGHTKGSYTGAGANLPSVFEAAHGGTLFLDEIGDLSPDNQKKLLTALSRRKYRRIGERTERDIDVHLICASSFDLREKVEAGEFRKELLNRINANPIRIPSLRERGRQDIELLATRELNKCLENPPKKVDLSDYFSRPARRFLYQYSWPNNVRQLMKLFENEAIRQRLNSKGSSKVDVPDLEAALDLVRAPTPRQAAAQIPDWLFLPSSLTYQELCHKLDTIKEAHIRRMLEERGGNMTRTARDLGICRSALYKLVSKTDANYSIFHMT